MRLESGRGPEDTIGRTEGTWNGRAAAIAVGLLALLLLACAGLAPAAAHAAPVPDADLNGDRVFDDLSARLAPLALDARVRVIVRLDGDASPARLAALQAAAGPIAVGRRLDSVDAFSATVSKRQVEELRLLPGVRAIEESSAVHAANVPGNSDFGVTKARTDLPALDGNGDGLATYSSGDLVAAVIDTGIDAAHHDLDGGKVLAFIDCTSGTCVSAAPYDDNGHGTHVAGTIAGTGAGSGQPGVAPAAALVGIKVLDASGSGYEEDVIAGVEWAVANRAAYGIRVLNLSLGSDGASSGDDALSQAVDAAAAAGLVVAVAAGNAGPGVGTVGSPAAARNVITVGAMSDTAHGGFGLASFSSRGPTLDGRRKPDIVAPGVTIVSSGACAIVSGTCTHNEAGTSSGTSMAAPFVAGVALLLLDAAPSLTPTQVKSAIVSTAVDWGAAGTDDEYGAGRLDAYAALATTAAGAALTSAPAVPTHVVRSGTLAAGTTVEVPLTVTTAGAALGLTGILPSIAGGATGSSSIVRPGGSVVTLGSGARSATTSSLTSAETGVWLVRFNAAGGTVGWQLDASGQLGSGAPVSTVGPVVSGTVATGQTLTASYGTWTGASPTSWGFQWQRCNGAGASCTAISGATARTYAVVAADTGSTLRAVLTFTNGSGTAAATSAATSAIPAPVNTVLPAVTGTVQDGSTLTGSDGTWSGAIGSYARRWLRCDAAGAACSAVTGATASTLVLHAGDIGATFRIEITVTAGTATVVATSNASALVTALSLAVSALPSVAGTAQDGQTLTGSTGTWTGSSPIAFTVQWQRCDAAGVSCAAITGATTSTYAVVAADIGSRLRFSVSATNAWTTPALQSMSAATAVVAAVPAPAPAPAASSGGGGGGGSGGGGGGGVNPDLELTVEAERPSPLNVGDTFRYVFRTTNLGPGGAQSIWLRVTLPAGLALVASEADRGSGCTGTSEVACFLDFLTPPQTATVKLTVRVVSGPSVTTTATVTLLQPDNVPANNTVTPAITLGAVAAVPAATRPVPAPATVPVRTTTGTKASTSAAAAAKEAAAKEAAAKAAAARKAAAAAAAAAAKRTAAKRAATAKAAAAKAAAAKAAAARPKPVASAKPRATAAAGRSTGAGALPRRPSR